MLPDAIGLLLLAVTVGALGFFIGWTGGVAEGRARERAVSLPARFSKDEAHCLIFDLFLHDEQIIRSVAAQDLKHLLGIVGPVPMEHYLRRTRDADGVPKPDGEGF